MTCCSPESFESTFDERHATKQLRRYRRRGPNKTTRLLLEALRAGGVKDASVLDVGAGVGVVHHELLNDGARSAVHVDAAQAHMRAAREEAARRGHAERVTFLYGDFVELADGIAPADIVTLDRVICCYPDMERLVAASAAKAQRLYGAVFPRERGVVKVMSAIGNWLLRLRRNPFRSYIHPTDAIDAALRRQGFAPRSVLDTFAWRVAVYARG
ncbi:MAG TPA: class I SAM-dependent methyltransferase [Gemmatimonadaceae bacterium]|nr:class I SAM-dependent methyltransferase [Gemmatimonadaceae bacterium]